MDVGGVGGLVAEWHDYLVEVTDPRVANWPLMTSPWIPLGTVGVYLTVVVLGPRAMKGKKPFNLQAIIVLYNFGLVLMSAYMCYEFFMSAVAARYSLICQPVDYSNHPNALRMARICWLYYASKYIEFADTVFFILRKKNGQITYLHVFHHTTMVSNWWLCMALVPGGQTFFHPMLNTGIHVVMYTYYGLAALGPHWQRYLWWKKYLTSLQVLQFVTNLIHSTVNIVVECSYPKGASRSFAIYAVLIMILFANFYKKTYKTKQSEKPVAKQASNDWQEGATHNGGTECDAKRTHID